MPRRKANVLTLSEFLEAPKWIGVSEASRLLGRHRNRVLQLIQHGNLRAKRLDNDLVIGQGEFRVRKDDLLRIRKAYVTREPLPKLSEVLLAEDLEGLTGEEVQARLGGEPPDSLPSDLVDQPMYEGSSGPVTPAVVSGLVADVVDTSVSESDLLSRIKALEAGYRSFMFVLGDPGDVRAFTPAECEGILSQAKKQISRGEPSSAFRLVRTLLKLTPEHLHSLAEWKRLRPDVSARYLGALEEPYALLFRAARSCRLLLQDQPGGMVRGTKESAAATLAERAEVHILNLSRAEAALSYALSQEQPRYIPAGLSRIDQAVLRYLGVG